MSRTYAARVRAQQCPGCATPVAATDHVYCAACRAARKAHSHARRPPSPFVPRAAPPPRPAGLFADLPDEPRAQLLCRCGRWIGVYGCPQSCLACGRIWLQRIGGPL